MALVNELASYVENASFDQLSDDAKRELKIRLLDSLGCAIGALEGAPIRRIKEQIDEFGGAPLVTLIGGGKTSPDRAVLYNSALVRYLDYNDSYLAKKETCHPSDNIGSVLAATEYAKGHGRDFLTALGVAYQVQCRLSDVAPVRHKGFDHTVQGSYGSRCWRCKSIEPECGTNRECSQHFSDRVQRTSRYPNRQPFELERACVPLYGVDFYSLSISGDARYHRSGRSL